MGIENREWEKLGKWRKSFVIKKKNFEAGRKRRPK